MKAMKNLLRNRNFILFVALVLGLLLPRGSRWTEHLTLPALSIVMSLSTMGVSGSLFRSPRSLIIPALFGLVMNYVVLGSFILGISALVIYEDAIWKGFVLLAVVPPAVAIIPFSDLLGGNSTYSIVGIIGAYFGALIIMPLMLFTFLGFRFFDPGSVSVLTIFLIIVPLVISRILLWKKLDKQLKAVKGAITNWCFFIVTYTTVGLNHTVFLREPLTLAPVIGIAIASTFFLGLIIGWVGKFFRIDAKITTSLVLLGTFKNYGLAAGIALALFSEQTALPATVSTIFMFVYMIWLDLKGRRSLQAYPRVERRNTSAED
jgi:BASS family bile acid:Na+ symporter